MSCRIVAKSIEDDDDDDDDDEERVSPIKFPVFPTRSLLIGFIKKGAGDTVLLRDEDEKGISTDLLPCCFFGGMRECDCWCYRNVFLSLRLLIFPHIRLNS